MTQLEIRSIVGGTLPINIYACDVYQNQCVLFATINTEVPPTVIFTLPQQFDAVPAIGILLVDANGCERFEVALCDDSGVTKIFQNIDDDYVFQFMDFVIYQYEGPNSN
jgi:hypothetical protein